MVKRSGFYVEEPFTQEDVTSVLRDLPIFEVKILVSGPKFRTEKSNN